MKALKALILCLIVFLGVSSYAKAAPLSQVPSRILHVKQGGTSVNCTSWDDACDLQTALSNANPDDQVWVAAGTYKPTTPSGRFATFQLETGVAIYGGFSGEELTRDQRNWESNSTTLSGEIVISGIADKSYHVVTGSGVTATAVLDGFTISGGNANGTYPHNCGGGMYNDSSSPTLTNVTFSGNSAFAGGGMYNKSSSSPTLINVTFTGNSASGNGGGVFNTSSSPELTDVTFSSNTADNGGGGMYTTSSSLSPSSPKLTNVTFSGNSATFGGGMHNESSSSRPQLTNVTFAGNSATNGGGMYNYSSSPELTNVTFTGNLAVDGGGMYNDNGNPELTNLTFTGNTASDNGGGMYIDDSSPELTNVTFSANTASDNGGGMYNKSSSFPTLTNVTFTENSATESGGGMYNGDFSSPTLTNAIVWGNTPTLQIYKIGTGSVTITYSDIQGGYTGETNINLDPLLGPLADNGGFTQTHALGYGSPAIDSGNTDSAICSTTDQRGYMRPIDGNDDGTADCDMGAYEYGFTLTVETVGSGSVIKNPDKPEYQLGEVVNLTATAEPGATFIDWSGDASGIDNPLTVTINGNTNIIANFTKIYKLYLPLILKN